MAIYTITHILGRIGIGVFVFGILLKIMHWPNAGLFLFAGAILLAIEFLTLGILYKLPKEYSAIWENLFRATALFIGVGVIGIPLQMQHYYGGREISILLLGAFITGSIGYFFDPADNEDRSFQRVSITAMIIGGWVLLGTLRSIFYPASHRLLNPDVLEKIQSMIISTPLHFPLS